MKRTPCGEHCGCAAWKRGEPYTVRNPDRNRPDEPEKLHFADTQQYFQWLFATSAGAHATFENFRMTGCWNWVIDDPNMPRVEELFKRYEMAKEFGVKPADKFEDMPFLQMEGLLTINRELPAAAREKAKRDANAKN